MKQLSAPGLLRSLQILVIVLLSLAIYLGMTQRQSVPAAHALAEYAERTSESCGACHVNPGGGGPRTLRGLLWSARGRPDLIPELPGLLVLPDVNDGLELYDIACAGCHGYRGEGLYAMRLAGIGVSKAATRSFILRGIPRSGMPAFAGQFTDAQVEALVEFVTGLTSGQIELSNEYPLPAPAPKCAPVMGSQCGDR
jgi:mono/diheme cytochrome c family protein